MFKTINSNYLIEQINRASVDYFGVPTIAKTTGGINTYTRCLVPVTIAEGEAQPSLYLKNVNDGKTALQLRIGVHRIICENGLIMGGAGWSARIIHKEGPTVENFLDQIYRHALTAFANIDGQFSDTKAELEAIRLTETSGIELIGNLPATASAKEKAIRFWLNNAHRRPADQGYTAWQLYNLLNEYDRTCSRTDAVAILERESRRIEDILLLTQPSAELIAA